MTVSALARRSEPVECTGGETLIAYGYRIVSAADIAVWRQRGGASERLVLGIDYTVTGAGAANGGNIVLVEAATDGDVFMTEGDRPASRATDIASSNALAASTLNAEYDSLQIQIAEARAKLDRALLRSRFDDAADNEMADAVGYLYLAIDGSLTVVAGSPGSGALTLPVPVDQGGTGASSAATARTNLGLGAVATKNLIGFVDLVSGVVRFDVVSRTVAAPPGSPTDGQKWIIPAGGTGAWAGKTNQIAVRAAGAWSYLVPSGGWTAYVDDTELHVGYAPSVGWALLGASGGASGAAATDSRIAGHFAGNGHGGGQTRGWWTHDNRIFLVGLGTSFANGDPLAAANYFPIQIPWSRALGIKSVKSSNGSHFLIDANDEVWSWGANGSGQLGHGDTTNRWLPTRITFFSGSSIEIAEVIPSRVSASAYETTFFRELGGPSGNAGRVWGVGNGANYVIGNSATGAISTPVRVGSLTDIVEVAFDTLATPAFFRKSNGAIYVTGGPAGLANGLGTAAAAQVPTEITGLDNEGIVKMAVAGGATSFGAACMLKSNGTPLVTGTGAHGLGLGTTANLTTFTAITSIPGSELLDDVQMAGGNGIVLAFRSTVNNLHICGTNGQGLRGDASTANLLSLVKPAGGFQGAVDEIKLGGADAAFTIGLRAGAEIWTCGYDLYGNTCQGVANTAAAAHVWAEIAGLDGTVVSWGWSGTYNTAGLTVVLADGRAKGAGYNASGETGTQPGNLHVVATLQDVKGLPDLTVTGPAGPANEITIGTVTTGATGSSAAASLTGATPAQTLNLTVPRGDQGNPGLQGNPGTNGTNGASSLVSGSVYATKAAADAALSGLAANTYVTVLVDETLGGRIVLYQKVSSAYVFQQFLADASLSALAERDGYGDLLMRNVHTTLAHHWRDNWLRGVTDQNLLPSSITASQSGTTVTVSGTGAGSTFFKKWALGCLIRWASGEVAVIREVNSLSATTTCVVDRSQTVPSGAATLLRKPLVCAMYGDSMGQSWPMLAAAMYRTLGFGGAIFRPNNVEETSGLEFQTVTLAGGAAETLTTGDYATLPHSTCWSVPDGGSVQIEFSNPLPPGVSVQRTYRIGLRPDQMQVDAYTLCWLRAAGSIVVERKQRTETAWTTVATIDANAGSGTYGVYQCAHAMGSEWQYRARSSGGTTVKIVQQALWNLTTPGFVAWPLWRGSVAANNDMAVFGGLGASNLAELCRHNYQPDMRLIAHFDGQTGLTAVTDYLTELATDRTLWATAAPRMDHVYVGLHAASNDTAQEIARQTAIRLHALANSDPYVNVRKFAGDYSTVLANLGWAEDGQHFGYTGHAVVAWAVLRALGIAEHPGLASGRDVRSRVVDTDALSVAGRDVPSQIASLRTNSRRIRRGAEWSYNANGTTSKGGYLVGASALAAAIGTSDFTISLDLDIDHDVDRYYACISNTGGSIFVNGGFVVRHLGGELRLSLLDGSGNQYQYRWTTWTPAYTGRHTVTIRSNRANTTFDLFVDGALARAPTPQAGLGTTPTLATWTGVGQAFTIPQGATDAYSNNVYSVAYWPSRLTDAEIVANDMAGGPTTTAPDFWWDFGEGGGRQVFDRYGRARNGVWLANAPNQYSLGGGPTWVEPRQELARALKLTLAATTVLLPNERIIAGFADARDQQLPATPAIGDRTAVQRCGSASGAIRISQAALHQILTGAGGTVGTDKTTIGTSGFLTLGSNYGAVELVCTRADAGVAYEWAVASSAGTLTWT